jgi:NAD(P)H dehydrogenase (quinone)
VHARARSASSGARTAKEGAHGRWQDAAAGAFWHQHERAPARKAGREGAWSDAGAPMTGVQGHGAHLPEGTGITMILHRLEVRLRAIAVTTTFVRSAEHMTNWLRQLPAARAQGVLPSLHHPVTRAFPIVSAFDVGVVAAELLAVPRAPSSTPHVLHVEGPRRHTASDIAEAFARKLARPVVARELPRVEWTKALAGLGPSYAHLVAELQDAHNKGLIDVEPGGAVRRGTTELADAFGAQG